MTDSQIALLCIGEVMAEVRQSPTGYKIGFAGDTFNTAVYCRRLYQGDGSIEYMSRVGTDPLSNSLIDFAKSESIGTNHLHQSETQNLGIYSVTTDESGELTMRRSQFQRQRSLTCLEFLWPYCNRALDSD